MRPYSKVVIWGERLVNGSSHTHAYVHAAFFRAYQRTIENVIWLSDTDNVDGVDFSNTLFITEGFKNEKMPIRNDCWYVLHHVDFKRFSHIGERCLNLKAYSTVNSSLTKNQNVISRWETFADSFEEGGLVSKLLVMPWATHLLPEEIEILPRSVIASRKTNTVYWVGSITEGEMGNVNEIQRAASSLAELQISFAYARVTEGWESRFAAQTSWISPAIVGDWQRRVEYLPCRAFKNASYNRVPVTNSSAIIEMLDGIPPLASENYCDAFVKCHELEISTNSCRHVAEIVRDRHTYLNRIKTLETAFGWY